MADNEVQEPPRRVWIHESSHYYRDARAGRERRSDETEFVPATELARVRRDFQDRLVAKLRAMKENIVPINTMLEIIDDTRRDESEG